MDALQYAQDLVSFESTSNLSNASVSDYVQRKLEDQQFETERIEYDDPHGVRKVNIVGKRAREKED